MKLAATDAAALCPLKEQADGHGREYEKSRLCFGCDFSGGWYSFWKIIKIVATGCHILKLRCTKFNFGWGSPATPLWELTALPQTR